MILQRYYLYTFSGSYLQQPQTVGTGLPRPVASCGGLGQTNSTKGQMANILNGHLDHLGGSARVLGNNRGLPTSLASRGNGGQLAIPRATSKIGLATRGIQWTGRHDSNNNNNNVANNNK